MHKRKKSMFHFIDLWVFQLCLLQEGHTSIVNTLQFNNLVLRKPTIYMLYNNSGTECYVITVALKFKVFLKCIFNFPSVNLQQ
jgi:hypothetical protein